MFNRIKSFIKNKFAYIEDNFSTQKLSQKVSNQKSKWKKNGYVAILLSFATPAIIYGVKYAIDKSIFSSWNIFKKQNDEVYKRCATAIAYEVASHWNPALTLNQQIDSLQKIADETYNTYPEYHGGILGRAIAGLERIDIFDIRSLKVMQRTSMNSKYRYIQYKNANVSYYPYIIKISNNANPYCALYRFADSLTNELGDHKNHKRPPVAIWAYERENRLPRNIISETDIFIGPSSFKKMTEEDKNGKFSPFSTLSDEGAFVFTNAIPEDSNLKSLNYSSSVSQAYFISSGDFEKNFPLTKNNIAKMGIDSISKGGAISDNLMVADTASPNKSVVKISLEKKDKVKIVADVIDSSDPKKQYIDKDTAYATLAKCNVDIILSIPTNEAACNNLNNDAASITSGTTTKCHVDANKQTANAKKTPIYQIAQAYRTFLKENFFYTQGVNVGLIPYSGKVSIPPNRENWTTTFNEFYSNAFINDISKFPRKCKPSFRMSIFYGTKGVAEKKLYDSPAKDGKISTSSYDWGTPLTGFPIMFRMGLQSRERDTTNTTLLGKNISYGGNYIYTGSILSNENPAIVATKNRYTPNINEPAEPDSALGNKFIKMNSNPCYGGYANLLGMKCEQDSPFFLPNPYYIIELTPNVHRIFEILGVFYPFYDNKNVSNFTFIPITWANNLLANWTAGNTSKEGDTEIVSQEKKTTNGRKKVLILIVNKPDYFEPGELTYLGFNNDYAEFSGVESDKIDFKIPYNNNAYYGDDTQHSGTITGYKRILKFSGTAAEGNGSKASGTFYFPEKALLKIVVEPTRSETNHDMIINSNGESLQIDSKKSILCNGERKEVNARRTIYVESNKITNKVGNEWCVQFECGEYVILISGELTNAIQPPRLEWESGSKIIHSYNGKVPFTITVKAPDATIKFSPYSSAGANEYSGTYKIPYGKSKQFNFKSNQTNNTTPTGGKQMCNKFSYSPSNISMSYTVSDRKIRWKGGTSGWCDEGLYVTYPAHSLVWPNYVKIYMTSRFDYCPVPCWKLVVPTHWEQDKHWFFVTWYDYGCKSYKYYDYIESSTYVNKRMYQRGEINFLLSEQITGDLSVDCSCNANEPGTFGYLTGGIENILNVPTSRANLSINLSSRNSIALYQDGKFGATFPMTRGPKPWVSSVRFYYMAGWLLWFYPAYAAAALIFGIAGLVSSIVYGFNLLDVNVLHYKYSTHNAGCNLYGAVFSVNDNIYQANITNNGSIRFLGTGNISVTANAENNIPTFSLTKKSKGKEQFSFDARTWTPNEKDGESLFIRKKYVTSKDYEFKQLEQGGNRFDITVNLTDGAKIVSVEPDYDNVDMEEENIGEKAPTKPKQKIEWSGGNIIKTIGGQTPIKITVSPKEECKATFSVPHSTDPNKTLTSVYQIKYGATETADIIQSNTIKLEYNSKASDSKKAYKFSYNLQNTQMKYKISNRKIRWKGGDQEWSDEGVSITNSANITKGLMKNTEDKTGSKKQSNTGDNTGVETRSDTDSHVICTSRKDYADEKYEHTRGRIVWQFPEKVTGTASVYWKRNPPFFPTTEELLIADSIKTKQNNLGNENDEHDVTVSREVSSEDGISFIEKKGGSKVEDNTRTIYGQHNVAKKYVDLCTKEIDDIKDKMSLEEKTYVEDSKITLNDIEKRLDQINNAKDQATEDKSPPRNEPPTDENNIQIDEKLKKLYAKLDIQIDKIAESISAYKDELRCYIGTKKEKLKTLYGMKREIDRVTNELENLKNGQEYFDSKMGYYETNPNPKDESKSNAAPETVPNAAPTKNDKLYFKYKKIGASGIRNPQDEQYYINLDSVGDLQYMTLESDKPSIEYKSITNNDNESITNNEYKYWGVENNVSPPSTSGNLSIGKQENNIDNIQLSNKDMFAVFQKESYLSGHRFYYMEFEENQDQTHISDVELPTSRKTSTTEKLDDQVVIIDKYANTDIYTKTTEINKIKNLSIIDPIRNITRNEITDTSSGVMTYTISGNVEFCGTGNVSVELKGAPKPYAYIKKLEGVGGVTEKFEFDTYYEIDTKTDKPIKVYEVDANGEPTNKVEKDEDGNEKYEIAKKSIYIDPYTYKYEPVTGQANTYQIKIELSNAVINTVEIMSDELAHPELSSHSRMVDGTTGKVKSSGGEDDTKHEKNLEIKGDGYTKLTNSATMVNTKNRASTQMYVLNYPGDANLLLDDTGIFTGTTDTNIGKQTFIGGMVNYATYAPGEIRKFFPFWRNSKYNYVTTSSTTASTNLKMCEFSYPMNTILLFGQQSLSFGENSFYKYKWQDPATAKTDKRDVYNQANALKYVVKDACLKLKEDYGGDENVRVYVIKYRAQEKYNSLMYHTTQKEYSHDYSEIENCASPSTFLGMNLGGKYLYNANNESDLKKALDEIANDIKKFAKYENAQCFDKNE